VTQAASDNLATRQHPDRRGVREAAKAVGAPQLLTLKQVAARYSLHPKTVKRFAREGRIPQPIPGWVGKHDPRWLESTINQHIDQMARDEKREQVA
jgi:predicted DNA-binding transcriptional regulator AlpA